jgi:hypothetical protein
MTAVLGAASIATSLAQTVYSVNAVGYVNVTVPANSFALLANPLDQGTNNTIANVLAGVPANTVVYAFDAATGNFNSATLRSSGTWTGPGAAATLAPGQGFFVKNAGTAPMTITFVGEVKQGTSLQVPFIAGFNLLGSLVPQSGKLETDLAFKAATNDKVYLFDATSQAYTAYTKRASGAWTGGSGEPVINVANGFFYQATAAGTWTRSFSVN